VSELPTGAVTLLFTDIEGSTRLLQALGAGYGAVLGRHRAILREAFAGHGGHEFGSEGDALFAAFAAPGDALAAAADAQRGLAAAAWPGGVSVLVRMGVHTGSPMVVDDDYVGLDVHRAARICSAGHGGQVLASDTTRELAHSIDGGLHLIDLGWHRLKDLDRPERLHQLAGPGLAEAFDPVRALPASSNLPTVPTSFVGRGGELAALAGLLEEPDVRLVTLTGPGGTGKTRLALEAGRALAGAFPDGVVFVALAAVTDPAMVGPAVVEALGLRNARGRAPVELAGEHLRDRSALLVLDNFEQVTDAAGSVGELLGLAPGLKVLLTSRIVLNLAGEHEFPVRPLPVPAAGDGIDPDRAMASDAVALFVQRARAVSPGFALDAANTAAVVDVCARLDGLPLAIELAASRLRLLTVAELGARLEQRLPMLASRNRDLPERQRTLRNTIDWSYQLLAPAEAALLRRLSVFVGGATLDAVEAVAGPDAPDVLDGLTTLVEHSLVYRDDAAEPARYRMLQTIREYAQTRLGDDEREAAARRHAEWFQARSLHATVQLDLPDQLVWLAWFDDEMDNLRAALAWALADPADGGRVVIAAELTRALGYLWYTHGQTQEAIGWLERVRATGVELSVQLKATVLYWYGHFADRRGDAGPAVAALEESAALLATTGDVGRTARALNALGAMRLGHRDLAGARLALEEARRLLADSPDSDDHHTLAHVDVNLAAVGLESGQLAEARRRLERALAIVAERGDRWAVASAQRDLARVAATEGDLAEAHGLAAAALETFAEWRDHNCVAETIEVLAGMAARTGQVVTSARLVGAAGAVREAVGGSMTALDRARLARETAPARAALGPDGFAAAAAEGASMTFEQAVGHALHRGAERPGRVGAG
jgi:predicted ATPase/class 3 adenylate cyclase